ncbi:MAG: hypothetical protein EXS58_17200 [Candidatus Latescibacteria bacterium]|nr:hypothetical protein [Candidatus Latescibacterota bacterium]
MLLGGCGKDPAVAPLSQEEVGGIADSLLPTLRDGLVATQAGGGQVLGMQGTLEVAGTTWDFAGYSPDGNLFAEGQLQTESHPARLRVWGELSLSGAQQGTLFLDLTLNVTNGTFAGVARVGDTEVPVSGRLCCLD